MADETLIKKRITTYTKTVSKSNLTNSDVMFVDNPTEGTRKIYPKSIIDNTITSSGVHVHADSPAITDVNDQPVNTVYTYDYNLQSIVANLPSNKGVVILHYSHKYSDNTSAGQVMIAIERGNDEELSMYFRSTSGANIVWSNWTKLPSSLDVETVFNNVENINSKMEDLDNALYQYVNYPLASTNTNDVGKIRAVRSSITIGNEKATISRSQSTGSFGFYSSLNDGIDKTGHKFYIAIKLNYSLVSNFRDMELIIGNNDISFSDNFFETVVESTTNPTTWTLLARTISAATGGSFTVDFVQIVDLSLTFGKGHEPSAFDFKTVYKEMPYDFHTQKVEIDKRILNTKDIETIRNSAKTNKIVMAVSTYRDNVRDNDKDYYYAISKDGGKSFYEIKDSKAFADSGVISSDVQAIEYKEGLLLISTYFTKSSPYVDFKMSYTDDFLNYSSIDVNLGFIQKSLSMTQDAFVWAPQIITINNDFYIIASISEADTQSGSVYDNPGDTTRYLYPYYVKVKIDVENGLSIIADGNVSRMKFANSTESIMDVSLYKYKTDLYAIYKDRIYNIVNISKSTGGLSGTFNDYATYLGDKPYMEAGYFSKIGNSVYAYMCSYDFKPYCVRKKVFDIEDDTLILDNKSMECIGTVNGSHTDSDGIKAGMRNPYPIELSDTLLTKFLKVYNIPTNIPEYKPTRLKRLSVQSGITKASHVIFNKLNKLTVYPDNLYIPGSATIESNGSTINCDMCFSNEPAVFCVSNTGETHIRNDYSRIDITKADNTTKYFYATHGRATEIKASIQC